MPTKYFLNLNYLCNERCVFCASDLTNSRLAPRIARQLSLDDLGSWMDESLPRPGDRVMIAGGEPTLHPGLFQIVRAAREWGAEVTLFTNGLLFADLEYAAEAIEAGVSRVEIALFGACDSHHDAVTQTRGSFARTVAGLGNLGRLHGAAQFTLQIRLLVSRQTFQRNPEIVEFVHHNVPGVDEISLNRLILSDHATSVDAAVSWPEARASINDAARRILSFGYQLVFEAIPLCLFDYEVADFVATKTMEKLERIKVGLDPARWDFRYLDPYVAAGLQGGRNSQCAIAMPNVCKGCKFVPVCGRIEDWYNARYGAKGLSRVPA